MSPLNLENQEDATAYVLMQRRVIREMRRQADELSAKANMIVDGLNAITRDWEIKGSDL